MLCAVCMCVCGGCGGCRVATSCSRHLHFSLYRIAVVPVMFAFVACLFWRRLDASYDALTARTIGNTARMCNILCLSVCVCVCTVNGSGVFVCALSLLPLYLVSGVEGSTFSARISRTIAGLMHIHTYFISLFNFSLVDAAPFRQNFNLLLCIFGIVENWYERKSYLCAFEENLENFQKHVMYSLEAEKINIPLIEY